MISHWLQPIQSNDIVRITTNELSMTMRLQKRKKSFCFGVKSTVENTHGNLSCNRTPCNVSISLLPWPCNYVKAYLYSRFASLIARIQSISL